MRAFAALLVVIHHAQHEAATLAGRIGAAFVPGAWLPWPAGVDVFFVISGFIIVHAAGPLYGRPGARARFAAHRIARLVPLYWLVTGLYLALGLAAPALLSGEGGPPDGARVLASFLFWPMARPDGAVLPLYGLGWTLNYEMAFYALFALGLGLSRRGAVAWLVAALALLVLVGRLVPSPPVPLVFWSDPIILEFALGAGLALARAEGARLGTLPRLALAGAGLLALAAAPGARPGPAGARARPPRRRPPRRGRAAGRRLLRPLPAASLRAAGDPRGSAADRSGAEPRALAEPDRDGPADPSRGAPRPPLRGTAPDPPRAGTAQSSDPALERRRGARGMRREATGMDRVWAVFRRIVSI
ncbi:acyltransferase [Methylorubrum populi]|uniref:acyltransferase family protein n=1 Tax=Methylorubrum populi TaxID=223967 RepID=UPI002F35F5B3